MINIRIVDNGQGLTTSSQQQEHKSMAIDITKNRLKIAFHGKLKEAEFKMETIHRNNKTETYVSFNVPYTEIF